LYNSAFSAGTPLGKHTALRDCLVPMPIARLMEAEPRCRQAGRSQSNRPLEKSVYKPDLYE